MRVCRLFQRYNQDYWFFQNNNFQSMASASAVVVFSSRLRDVDDGSNKVAITGITKVKLPFLEAVAVCLSRRTCGWALSACLMNHGAQDGMCSYYHMSLPLLT